MSQMQLVERVSALRKRLEEIAPAEPLALSELHPQLKQLQELCQQTQALQAQLGKVHDKIEKLADKTSPMLHSGHDLPGPRQLSWQTRRLLLECRHCLQSLRTLGDEIGGDIPAINRWLLSYQLTVQMTECLLRGLLALPDSALEQNRLAQGLAGWLSWLKSQVSALTVLGVRYKRLAEYIYTLSHALANLSQGRPVLPRKLLAIAEELTESDLIQQPLELIPPALPAERWAAIQGWNTAQIVARLVSGNAEWRGRAVLVVLASLLHDCGMATVSPAILEQAGPLDESQRRQVEAHVGLSAEAVRLVCPEEPWLAEGVRAHHERLDGSGYPAGLQGKAINSLARLLAVAGTYAALCTPRSYRPAYSPRQAVLEVLAEAERGRLDIATAELLLELSLYPVGSLVELSDGSIAQVVALNQASSQVRPPMPVVAVLLDGAGKPTGIPRYLNLAYKPAPHIVRSVSAEELQEQLSGGFCVQMLPIGS